MVVTDASRDALLTDFGRTTLTDRYLLPGETYQGLFARVATAYADDDAHAQRLYDYMSKLWFMPATPVLSNGGADRGLPISCFLNDVEDNMEGIVDTWNENIFLAAKGGGIGTNWSKVRSIGEKVKHAGQTSGVIPFIRVMDSMTLAISQGSLRRGSAAVYLNIHHPEIEEFLGIRKPSGDTNRKSLNLHHGIAITDEFMVAVRDGTDYELRSPKSGLPLSRVDARHVWQKILETRIQTGEPYLLFTDTATRAMPIHQQRAGLKVSSSNLCVEIMLHTSKERTAVCCLSSVNAETYPEWKSHPTFVEDIMRFLDNVLQDFIDRAPPEMSKAVYAAHRERSVGLGLMGFHSFLQSMGVPFEGAMAKVWNNKIFKHLRLEADLASHKLATERGPCPDALAFDAHERFSHKLAVAPTASISIICGGTSAGIDPITANIYVAKTLSGTFVVKNKHLEALLAGKGVDVWDSILEHEGSVQHLDCLTAEEKAVFKTAFELDQRWVIELAADRKGSVCQGQSVNIFLPSDVEKKLLHQLHFSAWERGIKSLYYLRSMSLQRASHAGSAVNDNVAIEPQECLACQ
jgi:ribonucleoside-diphosphate reductase alpha chain